MPQLDLAVSRIFYDSTFCDLPGSRRSCIGFPIASHWFFAPTREVLNAAPRYIGSALLIWIAIDIFRGKRWQHQSLKNQVVVLSTLLLGPLLAVNSGFKEIFGRVRPRHIEEFGGPLDFTLAGDVIGQCNGNCSFVSGEASAGGWLFVCALLFVPKLRPYAYGVLFALGVFMALLRVSFGAHFISDAVLGYLVPPIICAVLALLITQKQKSQ